MVNGSFSELPLASLQNEAKCENEFHFHIKGFALDVGLKQRQTATRKWPINALSSTSAQLLSSPSGLEQGGHRTPVGRTRDVCFPNMPVTLTEETTSLS